MCKYKLLTKKNTSKGKSDTRGTAQCQTEATDVDLFFKYFSKHNGKKKEHSIKCEERSKCISRHILFIFLRHTLNVHCKSCSPYTCKEKVDF